MKQKLLCVILALALCFSVAQPALAIDADGGATDSTVSASDTDSGNTDGGNTDGGTTEGGSTEGGNTDGGTTEGGSTEGGNTEGGSTEGGTTEGGSTEDSNIIMVEVPVTTKNILYELDAALREARDKATDETPITVKVAAGSYELSGGTLHIYSNTTLDCTDVTLTSTDTNSVLINGTSGVYQGVDGYNSSSQCSGYDGFRNMKIIGGTWVGNEKNTRSIFRFFHATNLTLENVTLTGGGCAHQVEVGAIDGFYVYNSTFGNFGVYSEDDQDALQIDIPCSENAMTSVWQDGTPTKNVEIIGCTFENCSKGVGSHSLLLGCYHTNILISGNTFRNIWEEAVVANNYQDCEISGNIIINCGTGVLAQYGRPDAYSTIFDGKKPFPGEIQHRTSLVVKDNDIEAVYSDVCVSTAGVRIRGEIVDGDGAVKDGSKTPDGDYYATDFVISDNRITTAGDGVILKNARKGTVSGNTIVSQNVSSEDPEADKHDGIYAFFHSTDNTITRNTITKAPRHGIFVKDASSAASIKDNIITEPVLSGIYLYDNSNLTGGTISGNSISDPGENGIFLNKKIQIKGDLSSNTVTKPGKNGIYLYDGSSVSGSISKNTLSAPAEYGIGLNKSAKAGSITSNTVTKPAKNGIYLYDGSSVSGSISSNTISDSKENGISLNKKSKVSGSISSNKVTKPVKNGVYLYDNSSVSGSISSNTVSDSKENGISLNKKSKVSGSISSNKVTKAGNIGINLYDGSSVGGSVTKNTVSSPASYGIRYCGSAAAKITNNKVSGSKKHGIYVDSSSKSNCVTVTGNTVENSTANSGIHFKAGKLSVSGNTLKKVKYGVRAYNACAGTISTNTCTDVSTPVYVEKAVSQTAPVFSTKKSAKKKQLQLKWKKISGISGYELQYSYNKDLSKATTKKPKAGDTAITLTGLTSGKTCYVRMRSYTNRGGVKVVGKWSTVAAVKVK